MATVMAKGANFLFAKKYLEAKYGRETWERIMRSLSGDAKAVWGQSLLATGVYPFSAFKEMMSALTAELKTAKEQEVAAVYEHIADQSLSSVYKIFFRLAHPSYVIRNYPKLWSMFFNAGTVEVPVAEKGHAVVKFLLPDIFNDWLPPACLGYSKKAVEMAGGSDLTMKRTFSGKKSDGLWETIYELQWKE